jgi:hypothetical protein
MSRQTHSLNAYEVGLTSGISDVDTSFPVESTVGLTAPGYLVIDPDDPTKREYFRFESINGQNLEMPNTGFRGLKGSAAGAQAHLAGARVRAVAVGQWLDDIFADIEDLEAAQAAFLLLDGTRAMTGDLNMGDNKITVLATPTLNDDAATKLYTDDQDKTLLDLAGTRPMTGDLQMGAQKITGMAAGAASGEAVEFDQLTLGYLPLVGGTMSGIINMGGSEITNLAPGNGTDAANVDQVNTQDNLRVLKAGDTMTGVLGIIVGRTEALRIQSGQSDANANHAYISFVADVPGREAQIKTWRGSDSQQVGIRINTFASAGIESLWCQPSGQVIARQVNNKDSTEGPTLRNMWWTTGVPAGGSGNKGDMAVVEGDGIYLKRLTSAWTKVASL